MNLLENLCKVAGRQGGTIHQYLAHNESWRKVDEFKSAYKSCASWGLCLSKDELNTLAAGYGITINWQ